MNLTITFTESDVVLAIEVANDMTVADLRAYAQEEAGFKPNPGSNLVHNGRALQETMTLADSGLQDDDMVQLSSAVADSGGAFTQGGANAGSRSNTGPVGDSTLGLQIETARQQILYDPQLFAQLSQQSPELAGALHDPEQFQKAYRTLHQQQLKHKAENEEIDRNFRLALDEMPEAFTTVTMLFANIEVNGIPVKAFVDSGAQTTIMSPECAERCHLSHLIDKRHRGMAYGVGQATILGRIHMAPIKIGKSFFACSMTVIEGTNMDFLLGLDMLKHHQATLDLKHNKLIMGEEELPFLGESEIPNNLVPPAGPAGASVMPKPGTSLPRNALNNLNGTIGGNAGKTQSNSSPETASARPSNSNPTTATPSSTSTATQNVPPIDETIVSNLINLGFTKSEVIKALSQAGGNADVAAAILFGE